MRSGLCRLLVVVEIWRRREKEEDMMVREMLAWGHGGILGICAAICSKMDFYSVIAASSKGLLVMSERRCYTFLDFSLAK
jgi:hypothetical protein